MNLIANNLTYKPSEEYHLNEVSFNFKEGNLYTILGRTLSGKTTLLKTIAGLLTPDSGAIEFDGKDFLKVPVWQRNVAMVYQQFINYPHLNVFENIAFPLRQRKIDNEEIKNKVSLFVSQKMGHNTPIKYEINKTMLGGVVLKYKDNEIDLSVDNKLDGLNSVLTN